LDELAQIDDWRGEAVIVVEGAEKKAPDENQAFLLAQSYLEQGLRMKEAAARAAKESGVSKNVLYQHLLHLKAVPDQ
jgi:16S rRNA (cytidine1402-2'-O)-methyltransferase